MALVMTASPAKMATIDAQNSILMMVYRDDNVQWSFDQWSFDESTNEVKQRVRLKYYLRRLCLASRSQQAKPTRHNCRGYYGTDVRLST